MTCVHIEVVRTYLELRDRPPLRPARVPNANQRLALRRPFSAEEYRALYTRVGERWNWRDRLQLSIEALDAYLASPDCRVWTLHVGGETAGYFELQRYADGRVEIMYFGLAAAFIGRGLGGWMLTQAVEDAFAFGATHVTLHTCTLDAPSALPNYIARGFVIVREERYEEEVSA